MLIFLGLFFISLFQFCFTIANKKAKTNSKKKISKYVDIILGSEIWSIGLIFLLQDFPFFIARLVILINFELSKNYMIYYMLIKNFILCAIEIYRIIIIYRHEELLISLENENKKLISSISSFSNDIDEKNTNQNTKLRKNLSPKSVITIKVKPKQQKKL